MKKEKGYSKTIAIACHKKKKQPTGGLQITGLQTRTIAQQLLALVLDKKISLASLLSQENFCPQYHALSPGDRAFVKTIVTASLRHRHSIHALLTQLLDRPLPKKITQLHHLIHLAIAQLLYCNIAEHAILHIAVEISKKDFRLKKFSGLINALLRRIIRQKNQETNQDPALKIPSTSKINSLKHLPEWFSHKLMDFYGEQKTRDILTFHSYDPPLDISVKQNPALWAEKLNGVVLPNGTVRLAQIQLPLTQLPGFVQGEWWVQNVSATLPVRLMGTIHGKKVADLCAAPGGKTAQLALAGAHVTAIDIKQDRLSRLKENMQRLGLTVDIQAGDFRTCCTNKFFDAVLLDVPCSSTGTIRRHPDIVWTKDEKNMAELITLQKDLLLNAINLTKIGGTIVFSNCSLFPDEGEDLIASLLESSDNIRLSPILPDEITEFSHCITPQGFLRTTPADLPNENPYLSGMDGFFVARLQRC